MGEGKGEGVLNFGHSDLGHYLVLDAWDLDITEFILS
jgi:hypothetical protein